MLTLLQGCIFLAALCFHGNDAASVSSPTCNSTNCPVYLDGTDSFNETEDRIIHEMIAEYSLLRDNLTRQEDIMRVGGSLVLSDKERRVNDIMMKLKRKIYNDSFESSLFLPERHFFKTRLSIEQRPLYDIIRQMPKGGLLHIHKAALVDLDWIVSNFSYQPDLYMCVNNKGILNLTFFEQPDDQCGWQSVGEARQRYGNEQVDKWIYGNMSVVVDDPYGAYPNQADVWDKFAKFFGTIAGLINYQPHYRTYWTRALQELYEDNVQYVELRGFPSATYEKNGTKYTTENNMDELEEIFQEFAAAHPDFVRPTFIGTERRMSKPDKVSKSLRKTLALKQKYPRLVGGFDLIANEDSGRTLQYYLHVLLSHSAQGDALPYILHAGETDWQGTEIDGNLLDAVLLNATRVGHAFAILKHPVWKQFMRERDIAIELNPLSNQALGLIRDLRGHPGAVLMAEGFPVVVCSDDPVVWDAQPLSSDFYMVYVAFGRDNVDLASLKQLAINSIRYSVLSQADKDRLMTVWENKWDKFLDEVLEKHEDQDNLGVSTMPNEV